ncbi:hypothetical protein SBOR_6309 [Sclerotinia borealis F-4128]|uniref:Glutaminase A N-terminal domain-containing protein n=1 Tax=Sclerotinia borealis (strain F-4128) TaxID=1432307 RepID=W9CC03_SCLBF|nr:hypothetical protein SBOR_6309 [Sclerotinia borealis F-4128]
MGRINYKTFAKSKPSPHETSVSDDSITSSDTSSESQKQVLLASNPKAMLFVYCRRGVLVLIAALLLFLAIFIPVTHAQQHHRHRDTAANIIHEPIQPPSYLLAVRNPYLSAWIPSSIAANISAGNAQFWTGQNLIWSVIARCRQCYMESFRSGYPRSWITPGLFLACYLTISAETAAATDIQIYSDIGGTWTGQTLSSSRSFTKQNTISAFSIKANNRATYFEASDQALWGEAIYSFISAIIHLNSYHRIR